MLDPVNTNGDGRSSVPRIDSIFGALLTLIGCLALSFVTELSEAVSQVGDVSITFLAHRTALPAGITFVVGRGTLQARESYKEKG